MAYTKYSLTPADNNAAPPNGAPEGMLPSAVNDTMRDMMSQIRDVGDGIRGGTYTMTAPVITGGSITGVALSGNTLTNPVITGGSINNTPIGATTANTGAFTTLGATGVATFSAGTVSAPAITTTGDTNTGIFFPAADTIAFTEGGVESMRITSAGNIGIGTSTPATNLHINETDVSGTDVDIVRFSTTSGGVINFVCSDLSSSTPTWTLQTGTSEPLAFKQGTTERMRITSAGNVGIGTSLPLTNLDVRASGGSTLTLSTSTTIVTSGQNLGSIVFQAPNEASGSQSILPAASISAVATVANFNTTNNDTALVFSTNATGASPTERMRIDSSGNVGIGTSSPASKLDVVGSASFSGNLGVGDFAAASATGLNVRFIGNLTSTDIAGVSVSISAPATASNSTNGVYSSLRTTAESGARGTLSCFYAEQPSIGAGSSVTSANGVFVRNQGNAAISNAYGIRIEPQSGSPTTNIGIFNEGTSRFNGNIGLNTAPAASGTGITFPATQSASSDANTLDDYEEGTWTPLLDRDGGGEVVTYTSSGTYTKVGRVVSVSGLISITAITSQGSGNWFFDGLPFTPPATFRPVGTCYGGTSLTTNILLLTSSQTYFYPTNDSTLQTGNISTGTIYFSVVYQV